MKKDSKQQMIEGALQLLAQRGLQETSFSEVLKLTQAPRGSIYHHFPGGKDQLVTEALRLSEQRTIELIRGLASDKPEKITAGFLGLWRHLLETSDYTAGCSAVAVTVGGGSPLNIERATSIFRSWHMELSRQFTQAGLAPALADGFAMTLIAASEGAVVIARAEKKIEPFNQVADQLIDQARAFSTK